jgi:hypothetical protein
VVQGILQVQAAAAAPVVRIRDMVPDFHPSRIPDRIQQAVLRSGSAWMYHFGKLDLDLDPHQSGKMDPDPHLSE